jgi:hypothetical protein
MDMFRFLSRGLAGLFMIVGALPGQHDIRVHAAQSTAFIDPSAACARWHAAIYERCRKTPMANAIGPAANGLTPADFRHAASGTQLWNSVFSHDRVQLGAGLNLAVFECGTGQRGSGDA